MSRLDEDRAFKPLNIAVLTISDTRTSKEDRSGDCLEKMLRKAGHECASREIIPDDIEAIRRAVTTHIKTKKTDVVITTGGTGLTGRDVTVEALKPLYGKEIDGFSALMHMMSYETVGTSTLASRACAGLVGETPGFFPTRFSWRL